MAIISSATIITSLSLFHMTLGFFFLTSPGAIADQTLVFILGEAMGLVSLRWYSGFVSRAYKICSLTREPLKSNPRL
jgi:hypothetical protein